MAPMDAIWLVLVMMSPTRPPPTFLPYRSATGIGYGSNNNIKEVKESQQILHDGTPLILLYYFTMMHAWYVHIGVYDKSGHELTLRIIL